MLDTLCILFNTDNYSSSWTLFPHPLFYSEETEILGELAKDSELEFYPEVEMWFEPRAFSSKVHSLYYYVTLLR